MAYKRLPDEIFDGPDGYTFNHPPTLQELWDTAQCPDCNVQILINNCVAGHIEALAIHDNTCPYYHGVTRT